MNNKEGSPGDIEQQALAHVAKDGRQHLLIEHLRAVAEGAAAHGRKLGAEEYAYLAGLWHDLGKYSGDFQSMIRRENGIEAHIEEEGGLRDHSTAGAVLAVREFDSRGLPIAFVIAGHHTGLADGVVPLKERFANPKREALLPAALKRVSEKEILEATLSAIPPAWMNEKGAKLRGEMWIRMLFSALCDADFLDTESFFEPSRTSLRESQRTSVSDLCERLQAHMHEFESLAPTTSVNGARADVRRACLAAGTGPQGLFSLTVPTGGGKTLASMAFALEHARRHALDRVVVVIPFTSIIEQSARVYRRVFGDAEVIEHHSALDPIRETARNRVASENWDARIVVTTTVQLFESLLGSRPSKCRKFHNLARSVIILDEAQSLPGKLLPTILDVLQQLVSHYKASVVISTATQPALGRSATLANGFEAVHEICPPELKLFERLKRVSVAWPTERATSYANVAKRLLTHSSVLAIVHRRDDARSLCQLLDSELGDQSSVHLSALMTPVHRMAVLATVREQLAKGADSWD